MATTDATELLTQIRSRFDETWIEVSRRDMQWLLDHVDQLTAELAEDVGVLRALRRQRDEAEAEREQLRKQFAAVRAYADDLYNAPHRVSACGVRERLLDILTPTGPARTIEEAMAGRPATPKESTT